MAALFFLKIENRVPFFPHNLALLVIHLYIAPKNPQLSLETATFSDFVPKSSDLENRGRILALRVHKRFTTKTPKFWKRG